MEEEFWESSMLNYSDSCNLYIICFFHGDYNYNIVLSQKKNTQKPLKQLAIAVVYGLIKILNLSLKTMNMQSL